MPELQREHLGQFPVVVIGAGITGCGILRDLCLHQIKTLIIEQGDFLSQTSSRSSKMLHGGIRYLQTYDFDLVKEALLEKNLWRKLLPELCKEYPFHLPIYSTSKYPKWMTKIGLLTYDFLSQFQNSPCRMLSSAEALQKIPSLKKEGLKGAGLYYDVVMDDTKMGLEVLLDGLAHCPESKALNYKKLTHVQHDGTSYKLTIEDTLTGKLSSVRCFHLVFALGPFTDEVLSKLSFINWAPVLLPSKGSHLWLKKNSLNLPHPVVLQTKDDRVLFVIPHEDKILAGTTEAKPTENFFNPLPSGQEIDYILDQINSYFDQKVHRDSILSAFAGIRPLVHDDAHPGNLSKTTRTHKIYRPMPTTHVIVGGKYTTFRIMAQEIVRPIVTALKKSYSSMKTQERIIPRTTQLKGQSPPSEVGLYQILETQSPKTFEDLLRRRLGIYSRAHWNFPIDFDKYFISHLPLMAQFFHITEEEIKKFT